MQRSRHATAPGGARLFGGLLLGGLAVAFLTACAGGGDPVDPSPTAGPTDTYFFATDL
jgi:hypothetical protein